MTPQCNHSILHVGYICLQSSLHDNGSNVHFLVEFVQLRYHRRAKRNHIRTEYLCTRWCSSFWGESQWRRTYPPGGVGPSRNPSLLFFDGVWVSPFFLLNTCRIASCISNLSRCYVIPRPPSVISLSGKMSCFSRRLHLEFKKTYNIARMAEMEKEEGFGGLSSNGLP